MKNKSPKTQKNNRWQDLDPEFKKEQSRYERAIPSRRFVIEFLGQQPGPLTYGQLIERLGLTRQDPLEAFEKRLMAMVRDGELARNRNGAFGPVANMNLIAGRVIPHRDGYGFVTPDKGGPDIFLPPNEVRALLPGDHVLVRITGTDHRGRPEGAVTEVLERKTLSIVGRFVDQEGSSYVIPDNPRVLQDVLIPPSGRAGARHGQMVVVELTAPPGNRTLPSGRITEVLGEHLAPGMEIEAAIRAHGLPFEWPPEVLAEAAALRDEVHPDDWAGREDLRELALVTIDGVDARDFDDAVYCERRKDGWRLVVAIADVAAYVRPDSPLDKEAASRGNSVYFPERVIPMLPEKISNGLCSLNPLVNRLCMVCDMQIGRDGAVQRSRFVDAVMHSRARLTYDEVFQILEDPKGEAAQRRAPLVPQLQALDEVFQALFKAREARGAIDFETVETRIVFDVHRKIERIVPVHRNRAHRLIEECMIAANVEAAVRVARAGLPMLYRVHAPPDAEKVKALREFLAERALRLAGGEQPSAKDFARVLERAKERPDAHLIQTVLLRSLMQARYNPTNVGHFGLALTDYAHFTSPIRRYPDLLLHRALKHAIRREPVEAFGYTAEKMEAYGAHCSMSERRADEATRDAVTWLKCEYMRDHVGDEFDGVITGCAPFGLFVELQDTYIDGLVHVTALSNDYYRYEPRHQRLIGERSGQVYGLGERLRVRVVRVNLDERKIDLALAGATPGPARPRRERGRSGRQSRRR